MWRVRSVLACRCGERPGSGFACRYKAGAGVQAPHHARGHVGHGVFHCWPRDWSLVDQSRGMIRPSVRNPAKSRSPSSSLRKLAKSPSAGCAASGERNASGATDLAKRRTQGRGDRGRDDRSRTLPTRRACARTRPPGTCTCICPAAWNRFPRDDFSKTRNSQPCGYVIVGLFRPELCAFCRHAGLFQGGRGSRKRLGTLAHSALGGVSETVGAAPASVRRTTHLRLLARASRDHLLCRGVTASRPCGSVGIQPPNRSTRIRRAIIDKPQWEDRVAG